MYDYESFMLRKDKNSRADVCKKKYIDGVALKCYMQFST